MTSNLDLIRGRQVVQTLTNQSGGAIIAGDVVIVSAANDESFTTTTSAAYNSTRVGVALDSIAAAAAGRILLEGYAPLVNVSASATRGHYLLTHTVAKQATSQAGYAAGAFGQIIKAGTTPSAVIFPVAQVGSAGITRSGSTTGDHLAVWNGSNADSLKDGGVSPAGNPPGYEFDYVEKTTDTTISATTEAGADTIVTGAAVSYDGSTKILVEFFAGVNGHNNITVQFLLFDGSSSIGYLGIINNGGGTGYIPVHLARRFIPSNASHTYSVRAFVSASSATVYAGAGGVGNFGPVFMRITKI